MELQDWLVNINNNKECEACMSLSTLNGATSACFERNSLITRLRSPPKSSIFLDSVKLCTSPDPPACYIFDDNLQHTSLNGEKTSRSQIKRRNKSSGYNLCRPPFCIILVRYKQTHLLAEASHEGPRGRFPLSAYNNESWQQLLFATFQVRTYSANFLPPDNFLRHCGIRQVGSKRWKALRGFQVPSPQDPLYMKTVKTVVNESRIHESSNSWTVQTREQFLFQTVFRQYTGANISCAERRRCP